MNPELLTKGQLINFDIAKMYGNFLMSLQHHFKEALSQAIRDKSKQPQELETGIISNSEYFDLENFKFLMDFSSELEEISFKIRNHESSIRITIAGCAGVTCPGLELYVDPEDGTEHAIQRDILLEDLFSQKILDACVLWLIEQRIDDDIRKEFFESL